MEPAVLYDTQRSGNAWKVRLMASFVGIPLHRRTLSIDRGDLQSPDFASVSRFRQVPVLLLADGRALVESGAILHYLAADTKWWPEDQFTQADVLSWISFEQSALMHPLAQLRLCRALHPHKPVDPQKIAEWDQQARQALGYLNARLNDLGDSDWLATEGHPSIADVALYPYTRLAGMGGIDFEAMPAIRRWLQRFENLPNYSPLFPGHPELNESTVEMR